MNWRYVLGDAANRLTHAVLACPSLPLMRWVPRGRHWMYDVQRARQSRRADVIFDVGANIGQTAWGLVRYFPGSAIYCFEPVQSSFDILSERYGARANVRCVRAALGDRPERRVIGLCEDPEQNTLVEGGPGNARLTGATEEIEVTTADNFCAGNGIAAIDILKMDVQGWELNVLRGCARSPAFVLAEVGLRTGAADMQDFASFHAYMEQRGYLFGGLYEQFRYGPHKEFVLFANALYVLPPDRATG